MTNPLNRNRPPVLRQRQRGNISYGRDDQETKEGARGGRAVRKENCQLDGGGCDCDAGKTAADDEVTSEVSIAGRSNGSGLESGAGIEWRTIRTLPDFTQRQTHSLSPERKGLDSEEGSLKPAPAQHSSGISSRHPTSQPIVQNAQSVRITNAIDGLSLCTEV